MARVSNELEILEHDLPTKMVYIIFPTTVGSFVRIDMMVKFGDTCYGISHSSVIDSEVTLQLYNDFLPATVPEPEWVTRRVTSRFHGRLNEYSLRSDTAVLISHFVSSVKMGDPDSSGVDNLCLNF